MQQLHTGVEMKKQSSPWKDEPKQRTVCVQVFWSCSPQPMVNVILPPASCYPTTIPLPSHRHLATLSWSSTAGQSVTRGPLAAARAEPSWPCSPSEQQPSPATLLPPHPGGSAGSSMPNTVINQTLSELNYKSVKTPIISSPGNNTTKVLFKLITQIPKCCPNEPSFCPELTKRKKKPYLQHSNYCFPLQTSNWRSMLHFKTH